MEEIKGILDILQNAVAEGRTVTIKAAEIKTDGGTTTATDLEITVE